MSNLDLYNKVRAVPEEAKKKISGGRMKGFTNINPVWRTRILTEHFGEVGKGWYYTVKKFWLESGANGEIAAFAEIDLFVKFENEWSMPITGVGGSMFVTKETSGIHTSDECYKMALTDALSVSCKALGIGADVYFAEDKSKYDTVLPMEIPSAEYNTALSVEISSADDVYKCHDCGKLFETLVQPNKKDIPPAEVYKLAQKANPDGVARCKRCKKIFLDLLRGDVQDE